MNFITAYDEHLLQVYQKDLTTLLGVVTDFNWADNRIMASFATSSIDTKPNVVKFNDLCHSFCAECRNLPTQTNNNCLSCITGYTLEVPSTHSNCLLDCGTGTYANADQTACIPCPTCCSDCSLSTDLILGMLPVNPELTCNTVLPNDVTFLNGDCETVDYDYSIDTSNKPSRVTITFSQPPISLDLATNIEITTESGWVFGIEFSYSLVNGPDSLTFYIDFLYNEEVGGEEITLEVSGVSCLKPDGKNFLYSTNSVNFVEQKEIQEVEKAFFELDPKTAKGISSSSNIIADFGQFLLPFAPGFAAFIAPLNIMKLAAVLSIKYSLRFKSVLKLFVQFREEDLMARVFKTSALYSDDYK